jgi:hypothetical protein
MSALVTASLVAMMVMVMMMMMMLTECGRRCRCHTC